MGVVGAESVKAKIALRKRQALEANLEALIEIGEKGVTIWKRNTPVVSGRLRNSESYTVNNRVYGSSGSDNIKRSASEQEVFIGTNVEYGPKVEFLSRTGSKGFTLRSYNELKRLVGVLIKASYRRNVK